MSGLNLEEVLKLTPSSLAKTQYDALKNHAISVLEKVVNHMKKDQLDAVVAMCSSSPAGDGMGTDKCFIDFHLPGQEDEGSDITDVTRLLRDLASHKK